MSRWLPIYIIALFFLTLALRIILIPYFDYNLGGIEPNVIYGIQRMLQGQPLYQDPAAGSFAIIQYAPLYYHTIASLAKLISADAFNHGLDVHALYMLCRTVSLVCNLLTVLLCALIIRRWGYCWRLAIIFSLPALIIVTVHYYTRGDSMQLLLFAAAIWAYVALGKDRSALAVLISAMFTAACILTKQSGVLCTGIVAFSLVFIDRRYAAAIIYLFVTAALFLVGAALLVHNDWHFFYQNSVLGLRDGIDASFLYRAFIDNHFLDMVPCYILCGFLVVRCKGIGDRNFRILLSGAAISWLFAIITGLKIGSSNNYFTEFLLFAILTIAYLHNISASLKTQHEKLRLCPPVPKRNVRAGAFAGTRLPLVALLILITSKTLGIFTQVCIDHSFKNDAAEYKREQNLYRYFTDVLHIREGQHIFFTERYFLDNLFIPWSIMPTKDVVTQVYASGKNTFDYSAFTAGMNSGNISYIVTSEKRNDINVCSDSLPFVNFDKQHFRFVGRVSGWCIYCFIPTVVMRGA